MNFHALFVVAVVLRFRTTCRGFSLKIHTESQVDIVRRGPLPESCQLFFFLQRLERRDISHTSRIAVKSQKNASEEKDEKRFFLGRGCVIASQ